MLSAGALAGRCQRRSHPIGAACRRDASMNQIIYIIGLIVVIAIILSFLGLR
jgi:hypothetical protein